VSGDPERSVAARIGRAAPDAARARLKGIWCRVEAGRARRKWDSASPTGPLDAHLLSVFAERYPVRASTYNYSGDDVLARGLERRVQLDGYLQRGAATLEIGSADAMTACALARRGCRTTAIDIDVSRTDPRAHAAGVRVVEMDATRLDFPDATFDLVYSFNVFEHLPDPAATLGEMMRVVRPGGVIVIAFTGLRWSPHGAHLYKAIGIPYVTVLFDQTDVRIFLQRAGLSDQAPWVNDYSIEMFRSAFQAQAAACSTFHYVETRNRWHARLIVEHPGVFKAQAPSFDSLMVDRVSAVLTKS
jgi:SAM-dependent methyltransferase